MLLIYWFSDFDRVKATQKCETDIALEIKEKSHPIPVEGRQICVKVYIYLQKINTENCNILDD